MGFFWLCKDDNILLEIQANVIFLTMFLSAKSFINVLKSYSTDWNLNF